MDDLQTRLNIIEKKDKEKQLMPTHIGIFLLNDEVNSNDIKQDILKNILTQLDGSTN